MSQQITLEEIKEKLNNIWKPIEEMREDGCDYEQQACTYEYAVDKLDDLVNSCIKKIQEYEIYMDKRGL